MLKRIRIHGGRGDDKLCKMIAIHAYAHHLNHTEAMQDERQNKSHGHEFWQIYGMLLVKAKERNLYHDEIMSAFAISGLICKWGGKILVSCCLLVPLCHLTHNYAKNAFIVAVSLR